MARQPRSGVALGEQHLDYVHSLDNLAALYKAIGHYAKAELLYRAERSKLEVKLPEPITQNML